MHVLLIFTNIKSRPASRHLALPRVISHRPRHLTPAHISPCLASHLALSRVISHRPTSRPVSRHLALSSVISPCLASYRPVSRLISHRPASRPVSRHLALSRVISPCLASSRTFSRHLTPPHISRCLASPRPVSRHLALSRSSRPVISPPALPQLFAESRQRDCVYVQPGDRFGVYIEEAPGSIAYEFSRESSVLKYKVANLSRLTAVGDSVVFDALRFPYVFSMAVYIDTGNPKPETPLNAEPQTLSINRNPYVFSMTVYSLHLYRSVCARACVIHVCACVCVRVRACARARMCACAHACMPPCQTLSARSTRIVNKHELSPARTINKVVGGER